MKIIVASEDEKKLIKIFIDELISSEILEELISDRISNSDIHFIENGYVEAKIEIGETNPLYIEEDNVIGICVKCGIKTNGSANGEDVSYEEWVEMNTKESKDNWMCLECFEVDDD